MKMVRKGYSWSGSEKNRFFKNDGQGHFYEMSHLAGLDQAEDGRGLALVDWDQDGRLDLWYRNRSAPRLRFMHNQTAAKPSLALKLQGSDSNRDAIGAVVELLPTQEDSRIIRTVRAGDLFLSQSSKWLHFSGHGTRSKQTARVTWPGGKNEDFKDLPTQGRLLLIEGSGKAQPLPKRSRITFPQHPAPLALRDPGSARIILPARLPFPQLRSKNAKGETQSVPKNRSPKLILLWSPECPHCKTLLPTLSQNTSDLEVIALNPPETDLKSAEQVIDSAAYPHQWGILEKGSMESLSTFQARLFDRKPADSVPLTILLDESQQAVALYRGPVTLATLLSDWEMLRPLSPTQRYHLAPPLRGTWFTNPLPPQEVQRLFPVPKVKTDPK